MASELCLEKWRAMYQNKDYIDSVKLTKQDYINAVPGLKLENLFIEHLKGKKFVTKDDRALMGELTEIALKYMAGVR